MVRGGETNTIQMHCSSGRHGAREHLFFDMPLTGVKTIQKDEEADLS